MPQRTDAENERYELLAQLWTSGWAEYHSLASGFVTAHSIILGGIILLLLEDHARTHWLAILVSAAGLFIALQMMGALEKCAAQTAYFAWQLRGLEAGDDGRSLGVFGALYYHFEDQGRGRGSLRNALYDKTEAGSDLFRRNYGATFHRKWWLRRIASFPALFGAMYLIVTILAIWLLAQDHQRWTGKPVLSMDVEPKVLWLYAGMLVGVAAIATALIGWAKICWWKAAHSPGA